MGKGVYFKQDEETVVEICNVQFYISTISINGTVRKISG